MTDWYFFHGVLILASLNQIDWAESPFAYKFHNFEAVYEFLSGPLLKFLEVAHRRKILLDLCEVFQGQLFVDLP